MIKKYLSEMKNNNPLILLDSSGGVGYLEFKTTLDALNGKPFIIILDDIHHVKHHRSYLRILKTLLNFTVVGRKLRRWLAFCHAEIDYLIFFS
jgi:hypothetical protein